MHLVVRTEDEPRSIVPSVRERLGALDPDLSAYAVQTLEERFDTVVFTRRFASVAMAVLAFMSLVLAAMGLYGVIAFLVGERRRELGLRIALGADSRKLVGHVLGEALNLVGVGVALGLAGAFGLNAIPVGDAVSGRAARSGDDGGDGRRHRRGDARRRSGSRPARFASRPGRLAALTLTVPEAIWLAARARGARLDSHGDRLRPPLGRARERCRT